MYKTPEHSPRQRFLELYRFRQERGDCNCDRSGNSERPDNGYHHPQDNSLEGHSWMSCSWAAVREPCLSTPHPPTVHCACVPPTAISAPIPHVECLEFPSRPPLTPGHPLPQPLDAYACRPGGGSLQGGVSHTLVQENGKHKRVNALDSPILRIFQGRPRRSSSPNALSSHACGTVDPLDVRLIQRPLQRTSIYTLRCSMSKTWNSFRSLCVM